VQAVSRSHESRRPHPRHHRRPHRHPQPAKRAQPVGANGLTAAEQYILQQTNGYRASRGLPPLTLNAQLQEAAVRRANYEAAADVYLGDSGFPQNIEATGYPWSALGQNDAVNWGYGNPAAQLSIQWWTSPEHQANILDRAYTELGVAVATSASGKTYGVVCFGKEM
jgi:uncharacterized protein YkwD